MFSPKIQGFLYGTLVSASLISVITYASGPDGVFGDYFDNMTGYCLMGGSTSEVLTGLGNNADLVPFGTKRCTSLKTLIGNIFGSTSAPEGQAIVGFKADGSPLYGDVNWHKDLAENISYTGAGNVGIGTDAPAYKMDINGEVINNGWYRSRGDAGWYSETHGGGIYMTDSTWVRTYNAKSFWANGFLGSDAGLTVGYGGTTSPAGGAIIAGNVGIGTTTPTTKLDVNGNIKGGNIRGGSLYMDGGSTFGSDWRMHIQSTENLYLNPWAGEVTVGGGGGPGKITADKICIGTDCKTAWPVSDSPYGGNYKVCNMGYRTCTIGVCPNPNPRTGGCSCPSGYEDVVTGLTYHYEEWDYIHHLCIK